MTDTVKTMLNNKNVIYKIENIINGNIYIGSAIDFKARKRVHRCQLNKGSHHSPYLQRSWNKYGESNFLFSVLESDVNDLIGREQYYIDTLNPVYNIAPTAHSMLGFKHKLESIEKSRKANLGRKVRNDVKERIRLSLIGNKRQIGNKNKRKVTKEVLELVANLRSNGKGCRKIAAITGLNKTTILNIFNKKFNYG